MMIKKGVVLCLLIAMLSLVFFGCGNTVKQNSVVKVMSYNLWGNLEIESIQNTTDTVDVAPQNRIAGVCDMLNGESIDVVGLQEVNNGWYELIKDALLDTYEHIDAVKKDGVGWMILYRKDKFELVDNGQFWLATDAPGTETEDWGTNMARTCIWALLKVKETGDCFLFLNTHLDTATELCRINQAEVVADQIFELRQLFKTYYDIENCPTVLVGDMNSSSGTTPYNILTKDLKDSRTNSTGKTLDNMFYSTSPGLNYVAEGSDYIANGFVIDHILVTDNVTVLNYDMIHTSTNLCPYGAYLSDHNAVEAEISFSNS